jgi:hypothetical protein
LSSTAEVPGHRGQVAVKDNRLMKHLALISLCRVGSYLFAANGNLAPAYPQYSLPHTECRVLPRTVEDRIYKLYIGLPSSFASHPERRYPVICVTDGYWAFPRRLNPICEQNATIFPRPRINGLVCLYGLLPRCPIDSQDGPNISCPLA